MHVDASAWPGLWQVATPQHLQKVRAGDKVGIMVPVAASHLYVQITGKQTYTIELLCDGYLVRGVFGATTFIN